ncbi:MAG: transcription termination factor Rho [Acidobacteria bacterium]|nr:MAG: transcription termination factor Rho [Acidobacteriota bacterium]
MNRRKSSDRPERGGSNRPSRDDGRGRPRRSRPSGDHPQTRESNQGGDSSGQQQQQQRSPRGGRGGGQGERRGRGGSRGGRRHSGRRQPRTQAPREHVPTGPPEPTLGILEVMPQGYGFLRLQENNYLADQKDVHVNTSLIKQFELQEGLRIEGMAQHSRHGNGVMSLVEINTVNGYTVEEAKDRLPFSKVISLDPEERIKLETTRDELSMRVLDLVTPIGKGQRGLIVAPPKTGKTTLLKKIANAISTNHPEMDLVVLLVDERPEEVTDFRRSVQGEVIASSADEMARNHVSVAEIVIERARRKVEFGGDTVILLDSLTRLSRAYNVEQRGSGKILSGGIDARTMEKPKKFFGAARNAEQGGSLTIIATALIDTGSRMDEVIFQEFKGTGNMELQLDRRLFDKRVFPCVDIDLSGTRKEEKLIPPDQLPKVQKLRRALSGLDPVQAMDKLLKTLARTESNEEFLAAIA